MTLPHMRRRRALRWSLGAAGLSLGLAASFGAMAQTSSAPLRLIVGFPPGGSSDVVARQLAESLRQRLGRTVLVENRAGAAGRIAPEYLKTAPADGSVILVTPNPMVTQYPSVYRKLSYDPARDLQPLAQVASYPLLISVGPAVPASVRTVRDYLQWAKADAGQRFFASPATGSTPHFVGVMLGREAGVELVQAPYKGDAPAVQDMLGGQIPMSINVPAAQLPHVGTGKLRVLATTGAQRLPQLPQVPTLIEEGYPALRTSDWFGLFVPAKTPAAVSERLQAEVRESLKESAVRESFAKQGIVPDFVAAAEFTHRIRQEREEFARTVQAVGFKPEE